MYLIFTVAVGVIAFLSCGLTFFFPFRESKSNNIYIKTSNLDKSHYLPLTDNLYNKDVVGFPQFDVSMSPTNEEDPDCDQGDLQKKSHHNNNNNKIDEDKNTTLSF